MKKKVREVCETITAKRNLWRQRQLNMTWCRNKGHPNENKRRLLIQILQGSQPPPLWQRLKGRQCSEKAFNGRKYTLTKGCGMRKP